MPNSCGTSFPTYDESGYQFESFAFTHDFCSWAPTDPQFETSPALTFLQVNGSYGVRRIDNTPFDLLSVDVEDNFGNPPVSVTYTGVLSGGGTVSQTITTDTLVGFETFAFAGFTSPRMKSFRVERNSEAAPLAFGRLESNMNFGSLPKYPWYRLATNSGASSTVGGLRRVAESPVR